MIEQTAFAPRDQNGKFMSATCPECGDALVFAESSFTGEAQWHCTGLIDPEDDSKPLQACEFTIGGHFYESSVGMRAAHGKGG